MRKSFYINSILIGWIAVTIIACDGVFVPDPVDPRLPKYTESGNNVAGAFVNDKIWESVQTWGLYGYINTPSFYVWPEEDSVVIRFSGDTGNKSAWLEFHLKNLGITDFEDLPLLKGVKTELDGAENTGYYIEECDPDSYKYKGIGQLYIKNIQINDSLTMAIFSGTFGFTATDSVGNSTKISYGRFDYRLKKDYHFFKN
ncbi:hypothetical protein [Maribellus maritimus]|uniref:hypothetical protein n=1 Tax=Maribellus maritimus TaxID=2870838 RepID=UPI001EE9CA92|nr:hypothetical protein [Maribellus maritimus]MCG6187174.1 hypothetical protein [Maribellus maritimus]